ncbi:hypothetical protein ACH4TX_40770 [Streptomyces sp. NPDC021098]
MSDIHTRLKERGLRLPKPPRPNGNYASALPRRAPVEIETLFEVAP